MSVNSDVPSMTLTRQGIKPLDPSRRKRKIVASAICVCNPDHRKIAKME